MRWVKLIGCILFFSSCGWFSRQKNNKEGVLAKVGDKYLYAADIEGLVPPGTSVKDSIQKVNFYVESWIKMQLLVQKAELNLPSEQKNFEKELEDLRTSLLIHRYQEKLIDQLLDTVVTEADIQKYYKENEQQFVLRNNIVKATYVIFSRTVKERDKVKGWMTSTKEDARTKLMQFCSNHAMTYQLTDTVWVLMDELERVIPFDYSSQETFLGRSTFYETQDSSMVYMVRIKDYKSKESFSPLEFERPVIKSLLINIRKQEILRKMEEDIYSEAVKNNTFQNFTK